MKRRKIAFLALTAVAALAVPASAGGPGELLTRIEGRWEGRGVVLGMEAEATMTWSSVLGGRFARLEFENVMTPPEGEPRAFAGHGYYPIVTSGQAAGRWFDSRGYELPLAIRGEGESLVVDWGSAATESGRTTYTLLEDGALEVVDEVRRDGELAEFGRVLYRRAP